MNANRAKQKQLQSYELLKNAKMLFIVYMTVCYSVNAIASFEYVDRGMNPQIAGACRTVYHFLNSVTGKDT